MRSLVPLCSAPSSRCCRYWCCSPVLPIDRSEFAGLALRSCLAPVLLRCARSWSAWPSSLHAQQNHRSRPWLAPTSDAERVSHSACHPRSASSPRTRAAARSSRGPSVSSTTEAVALAMPATFSKKRYRAPQAWAMSRMSKNRPLRLPSSPARRPARDKSWHGKPATTQSTAPAQAAASKVRMSDQTGAASSDPSSMRAARTAAGYASRSR